MQKNLPHKRMLTVTGVMLAFVLVVMAGNSVHVRQVAGWTRINPTPGVVFPFWTGTWFVLHATWEGILFQAVVLGSRFAAEWVNEEKCRNAETTQLQLTT